MPIARLAGSRIGQALLNFMPAEHVGGIRRSTHRINAICLDLDSGLPPIASQRLPRRQQKSLQRNVAGVIFA